MLLICAPAVVILFGVGGALLYSKGYFSLAPDARGRGLTNEQQQRSREFSQGTEQVWQAAFPTELVNGLSARLEKDMESYDDARFGQLNQRFEELSGKQKNAQLSNIQFQRKLLALRAELTQVELDVDPALGEDPDWEGQLDIQAAN